MRRIVAEIVLSIALLAGSLAFTGWWFRSTMLEPRRTERIASTALESPEVRQALGSAIAGAVADSTGQPKSVVEPFVTKALDSGTDLTGLSSVIADAHAAAIGDGPSRVGLTKEALTPLVGAELAGQADGAGFSVPQVDRLQSLRANLTGWLGALAMLCGAGVVAAMILHPNRPLVFRRLGIWLLSMSVWQLLITWVLPALIVPKLTDNPWALLAAKVAEAAAADLRSALAALCVAGVASLVAGVAWASVGESLRTQTRSVHPGGQPSVGSNAWNAWAAQNAANAARREERADRADRTAATSARATSFSSAHRRDPSNPNDDTWGL
ncbi:MAG: hypothetical protein AB7V43_13425 [Acidimicrobiia bacterium]